MTSTATPATPEATEGQMRDETVFAWAWTLFGNGAIFERRLTFTKDDPFEIAVNGGDGRFVSVAVPLYTRARSVHADIEAGAPDDGHPNEKPGPRPLPAGMAEAIHEARSTPGRSLKEPIVPTGEACSACKGSGTEADYVGLEMRPVEVECSFCKGSGRAAQLEAGAPAGDAVAVKPLEWNEPTARTNGCFTADTPFGNYSLVNEDGWSLLFEPGRWWEWSGDRIIDTIDTAKRAAQAHLESLIAPLIAQPSPPIDGLVERLTAENAENERAAYENAHLWSKAIDRAEAAEARLAASDAAVGAMREALTQISKSYVSGDTCHAIARAAISQAQPTAANNGD